MIPRRPKTQGIGGRAWWLALLCLFSVPALLQAQRSAVWCPDNGDGTYTNPVLNADYSDPDVCAVAGDFYLTASSFNCIPGLPILHSRDLVNWTIVGHALQVQPPTDVFNSVQHGCGVWAPSIRHHQGLFYIYWGDPDRGIMMVQASDPKGPWSEPVCVLPGRGMIDPCPLWDDDGRCYLVHAWAASRSGFNSVLTVRQLSDDGTRVVGQPVLVFDGGQRHHTTEGPKFYKHDGWYWIMCPAGGVQMGWQLAMRSRSPYGPYEARIVMSQGRTSVNGPHQGAWVRTEQGDDWFLHFNDRGPYGRVVYLQPMSWRDGWPVVGQDTDGDGCGHPVLKHRKPVQGQPIANPQESDEFDTPRLAPQWQWHANYNPLWGMPTAMGTLRLYTADLTAESLQTSASNAPLGPQGRLPKQELSTFRSARRDACEEKRSKNSQLSTPNLWQASNLLLQKTPAERFTATTRVCMASKADDQYGGLLVMGRDYSALIVRRVGNNFLLQRHTCIGADEGGAEDIATLATLPPTEADTIPYSPAVYLDIHLRVSVKDGECRFAYSLDGRRFHAAGAPFRLRQGKWIGAKVGLVSERTNTKGNRGWLDVDWFRITK